jgi:hypothetical protein
MVDGAHGVRRLLKLLPIWTWFPPGRAGGRGPPALSAGLSLFLPSLRARSVDTADRHANSEAGVGHLCHYASLNHIGSALLRFFFFRKGLDFIDRVTVQLHPAP